MKKVSHTYHLAILPALLSARVAGQLDKRTVGRSHFGGFGDEEQDEDEEDEVRHSPVINPNVY